MRPPTDAGSERSARRNHQKNSMTAATEKKPLATVVYRYGLEPPCKNVELIWEQMRLAHRYRNLLCEIERNRRVVAREIEERHAVELDGVWAAIKMLEAEASSLPKNQRRSLRQRIKRAKVGARLYRALVVKPKIKEEMALLKERAGQLKRAARAESGLYWGTYQLVEDAAGQSFQQGLYDDQGNPRDPSFVRWDDCGSVSAQIIKGMSPDDLSNHTQVRVTAPDPKPGKRCGRRGKQMRKLYLRIGSAGPGGSTPIFGAWAMRMQRPLPEGCTIKRVTVSVDASGPGGPSKTRPEWNQWTASFVIQAPPESLAERTRDDSVVAVDLGWRVTEHGVRVAYYHGSDGDHGELVVGNDFYSGLAHAQGIQAVRDRLFSSVVSQDRKHEWRVGVIDFLIGELRKFVGEHGDLPKWLRRFTTKRHKPLPTSAQAIAYLSSWRSKKRLHRLQTKWRRNRFAHDEHMFFGLTWWRNRDLHLWRYEWFMKRKQYNKRNDLYRKFACDLSRRYRTLILEDFNLRQMMARQATREAAAEHAPAGSVTRATEHLPDVLRQKSGPAAFRTILTTAFGKRGDAGKTECAHTTTHCWMDGMRFLEDPAEQLVLTCPNGHQVDQDDNAAQVLLKRFDRGYEVEWIAGDKHRKQKAAKGTRWKRVREKVKKQKQTEG